MKSLIKTAGLVIVLWGISLPLAELCPEFALWAAASKSAPKPGTLQKLFRRGMDAYDAKAYDDAVDIFSQLLQKQPDYVPAKIQLARTLYQLKRLTEAYKLFQQVDDISILEPDPSYEYGQAAFRANDYPMALKAFRNIPNGHPLFDLAGYYGGITAFKLGEYQLSLDLFAQAVVLPSRLLKSQKLYQKEAERLLIQQQKQELQNSIPPNTKNLSSNPSDEAPEPPKPYRYLSAEKKLALEPRVALQTRENTQGQSVDHLIKSGDFEAAIGLDRVAGSQKSLHWLLQSKLLAHSAEGGVGEVLFAPGLNQEQQSFIIEKYKARSLMGGELLGGLEGSLSSGTSLGIIAGGRFLLAGAKEKSHDAMLPAATLFLAQKNSSLETLLRADVYGMILDGDALFSEARQVGRIEYETVNHIRFALQGDLSEFAFNIDRVNGPDWQGRILSEIAYSTERGLHSKLGAFFEINDSQRLHDLGEASVIQFNYNAYGARFEAGFALGRFFDLSAEAWVAERETAGLRPTNEATVYALRNDFPTFITNYALRMSVHTAF